MELVALIDSDRKVVFSADPDTMKEWISDNPAAVGNCGVRYEPENYIDTISDFLSAHKQPDG